jgi:hypothetical protein
MKLTPAQKATRDLIIMLLLISGVIIFLLIFHVVCDYFKLNPWYVLGPGIMLFVFIFFWIHAKKGYENENNADSK